MKYFLQILCFSLCFLGSRNALAQSDNASKNSFPIREERIEELRNLKWHFMTNRMDLTTEEAAKIKPLYDRFEGRRIDLMRTFLQKRRQYRKEDMSEQDAALLLDARTQMQKTLLQEKESYIASLKTVLPPKDVLQWMRMDERWSEKMLERLREKRGRRRGGERF